MTDNKLIITRGQLNTFYGLCKEYPDIPNIDAAIRSQSLSEALKVERERVIDKIWEWVDNADNHTKDSGNGRVYVHLPDLVKYTESLRGEP